MVIYGRPTYIRLETVDIIRQAKLEKIRSMTKKTSAEIFSVKIVVVS